jgi:predicted  nucleic acid-binding Zn-ribbon protein
MSLLEIQHLLEEKRRFEKLKRLEQAYYNSCLIMNEKNNEAYDELRYAILGVQPVERLKTDIERYRMISERLKLRFPGGVTNVHS